MINKGQARRIAAEWQAAGNECSLLQHKGVISEDLAGELADNLGAVQRQEAYADDRELLTRELHALLAFARAQGLGPVSGWGGWDETPVSV
jgi:hypothetical protein